MSICTVEQRGWACQSSVLYQFAPSVDWCRLGRTQSPDQWSTFLAFHLVNQSATSTVINSHSRHIPVSDDVCLRLL